MVIDLASYRRRKAQPRCTVADEQQELVCVNWEPMRILRPEALAAIAALASPQLPETDEDLADFQALAYALASQV